ncbi:hypothetical protein [Ferrimonas sp. SCSIO 43195]|nr:hypothetical protein [Ferrimonas sp. SCSIO 43195]USD39198.1 hypothetical protein J8Z22_08900 [Ferrimonas sp. SCSIO 43195]
MSEYGLTLEQRELMLQENLKKLLDEVFDEGTDKKLFAVHVQQSIQTTV